MSVGNERVSTCASAASKSSKISAAMMSGLDALENHYYVTIQRFNDSTFQRSVCALSSRLYLINLSRFVDFSESAGQALDR